MKFSLIFIILFFATTASAEMYKWIDENGTINFGTTPPQGDYNVEKRPLNTQIETTAFNEDIKTPEIIFERNQPIEENIKYLANNNQVISSECITATDKYKKQVEWDKYRKSNGRIKDHFASEHSKELSESKYKMNAACGIKENVNKNELAQQTEVKARQEQRRRNAIGAANEEQQDNHPKQLFMTSGGTMTQQPGSAFSTTSTGETYFSPPNTPFSYGTGKNAGKTCFEYGSFVDCK